MIKPKFITLFYGEFFSFLKFFFYMQHVCVTEWRDISAHYGQQYYNKDILIDLAE